MAGERFLNADVNRKYAFACRIENLKEAAKGNKVLTGGLVTESTVPAMTVEVAGGAAKAGGVYAGFAPIQKAITAADPTNPRYDIISVDSSGTVNYAAGTPATNPFPPDLPVDEILLAFIFVAANDTAISNSEIADTRIIEFVSNAPIKGIMDFARDFDTVDSGTTDGTATDKLIESGQNFTTTVTVGDFVYNTTDETYATVIDVDSDTQLSLDADIMVSGEAYIIAQGEALPYGWVECNGQTLSDSDSVLDGETIPDLNGDNRFLRGNATSGGTGGAEDITLTANEIPPHSHTIPRAPGAVGDGTSGNALSNANNNGTITSSGYGSGNSFSILPKYYNVVKIMRVK